MTGNLANQGGAIANINSGVLTVGFCLFIANEASDRGGAIFNRGQASIGNGTQIFSNRASAGGGIYNIANGQLTITGNTWISGNTATGTFALGSGYGGGIANLGIAILLDVTITDNTSLREGGGIFSDATTTLTNVYIYDNRATDRDTGKGGGIYVRQGTTTLVSGCTLLENRSGWRSGLDGIMFTNNALLVTNDDLNNLFDPVICENQ